MVKLREGLQYNHLQLSNTPFNETSRKLLFYVSFYQDTPESWRITGRRLSVHRKLGRALCAGALTKTQEREIALAVAEVFHKYTFSKGGFAMFWRTGLIWAFTVLLSAVATYAAVSYFLAGTVRACYRCVSIEEGHKIFRPLDPGRYTCRRCGAVLDVLKPRKPGKAPSVD